MASKKVLMISYYFPPMGMSGVQRTLKFAKYLPDHGWEPHVLTVSRPSYFAFDPSLVEDLPPGTRVHRTASCDALSVLALLKGRASASADQELDPPEQLRRAASLCTQALFQPDNKIGWLPFAIRTGTRLLANGSFDLVYSTAPPYSDHLVGLLLKARCNLPLVVDFRDGWTQNPLHTYVTPVHLKLNQLLERLVLRQADAVVSINSWIEHGLRRASPLEPAAKFSVISHGYDPEDFESSQGELLPPKDVFVVGYAGTFYGARTPRYFLQALHLLLEEMPRLRPRIRAVFVGVFRKSNRRLVRDLHLEDVVEIVEYAQHRQCIQYLLRSHLLWLTIPEGPTVSTSKLYEYIGARRPILACVPAQGAAAQVVRELGDGKVVEPDDVHGIKEALKYYYQQHVAATPSQRDEAVAAKYDRRILTGQLAEVFDRVLGRR